MAKKSILFIAYFYPPAAGAGLPGSQRVVKLLRNMTLRNSAVLTMKPECYPDDITLDTKPHEEHVNTIVYRTGTFDVFEMLQRIRCLIRVRKDKRNEYPSQKTSHNIRVRIESKSAFQKFKDLLSTVIRFPDFASGWLMPAVIKGLFIIRNKKIDVIFVTGMPWTSLLIGSFLKMLTRKTLVVDFRDPWVDNPYIKKNRLEMCLDKKGESFVVARADLVLTNTEGLRNEMIKRYPKWKKKIIILTNSYDVNDFQGIPEIKLPGEKLIISHAGLLYEKRDPIDILKAFAILKRNHPRTYSMIAFHQIGISSLAYDLKEYTNQHDLSDHVVLSGQLDHKSCLGYLAASDVLLLIQPDTKTQIPSKLYEYIYLEKPILAITEKDGTLGELLLKHQFGEVFEPGEYEQVAEFLHNLAEQKMNNKCIHVDYSSKKLFDGRHVISEFENRLDRL